MLIYLDTPYTRHPFHPPPLLPPSLPSHPSYLTTPPPLQAMLLSLPGINVHNFRDVMNNVTSISALRSVTVTHPLNSHTPSSDIVTHPRNSDTTSSDTPSQSVRSIDKVTHPLNSHTPSSDIVTHPLTSHTLSQSVLSGQSQSQSHTPQSVTSPYFYLLFPHAFFNASFLTALFFSSTMSEEELSPLVGPGNARTLVAFFHKRVV